MPIEDKLAGVLSFIDSFKSAYVVEGKEAPPFYEGMIADSVCLAWDAPATKVKMLAIYLHYRTSELTSTFIDHLMSSEVLQIIKEHCVLWGWDVSDDENWHLFCEMIKDNFGIACRNRIQELPVTDVPCLIVLSKGKVGVELLLFVVPTPYKYNILAPLHYAVNLFEDKILPELIRKESLKKYKNLFCSRRWAKVTEPTTSESDTASIRLLDEEGSQTTDLAAKCKSPPTSLDQDIRLEEILNARTETFALPQTSQGVVNSEKQKKRNARMKTLIRIMQDQLTTRRSI